MHKEKTEQKWQKSKKKMFETDLILTNSTNFNSL